MEAFCRMVRKPPDSSAVKLYHLDFLSYENDIKTLRLMTDMFSKEQRSRCMSHIRSKNTKPELIVRKYLFSRGFRYKIHVKSLPGTPDIVLPKYSTCIFINGCFWHGHEGCKYFILPKTRTDWWKAKIERNIKRDKEERIQLRDLGWHVIQVWECQLKPNKKEETLNSIEYTLNKIFLNDRHAIRKQDTYSLPQEEIHEAAAEDGPNYG